MLKSNGGRDGGRRRRGCRNGKGNLCTERAALEGLSCRTSGLAAEDKNRSPLVEPQNPQDPSAAKDPPGEDPRRFRKARACARARGHDFSLPSRDRLIKLQRDRDERLRKDPADPASERWFLERLILRRRRRHSVASFFEYRLHEAKDVRIATRNCDSIRNLRIDLRSGRMKI